jgi:type II secretory pathway component PulM
MNLRARLAAYWAPVARWYAGYSQRDQRMILGVALLVALSFVYVGPIEMVRDYRRDVQERMADGQQQIERALKTLRGVEALRRERDDVKQRLKAARAYLLPGNSGTLGAAELEEQASTLAREMGVEVRTKQVMKEEAAGPYRRVAVRMTLAGDVGAIAGMLAGLEYDRRFTVPFMELSRRGALVGANVPRTLTATVEVAGFVASGDAGPDLETVDETFIGPPWPPPEAKAEEQPEHDRAAPAATPTEGA